MNKLLITTVFLVALAVPRILQAEMTQATLTGYEEVPSVLTPATGQYRAMINRGDQSIDYELTYSGLVGIVSQAHIHVAQPAVNGSIVIWLCQTPTLLDPTGLAPQCPQQGTVTGTITSANVIDGSMPGQQLGAGELDKVIDAMRAGVAYVNVHTFISPGGEIRGQIRASKR